MTMKREQKVALVFGASRGIGRQICLSLSKADYTVVLCSKTTGLHYKPDPNSSSSTIDTVLKEIIAQGGSGLAIACDVRREDDIKLVVDTTISTYGRIDALIYNPGAIWWSAVETTPLKRYELMHEVNARGMYIAISYTLPIFHDQKSGRFILVSPPIYSRFLRGKTAYAMTKFSASVMTLGLGMDISRREGYGRNEDIAVCSIWPAAAIESAATQGPGMDKRQLRTPTIFGDAIIEMLAADVTRVNGRLLVDEDFLRQDCGYTDQQIDDYALVSGAKPRRIMPAQFPELAVTEQDDEGDRRDSAKMRHSKL